MRMVLIGTGIALAFATSPVTFAQGNNWNGGWNNSSNYGQYQSGNGWNMGWNNNGYTHQSAPPSNGSYYRGNGSPSGGGGWSYYNGPGPHYWQYGNPGYGGPYQNANGWNNHHQ